MEQNSVLFPNRDCRSQPPKRGQPDTAELSIWLRAEQMCIIWEPLR